MEERIAAARREWTYRHQSPDGRWSSDGFDAQCEPMLGERCTDRGDPGLDVGVTGLTLFMFAAAGYDSQRPGPYRDAIAKGFDWLVTRQDAEGRFGSPTGPRFHWQHACATLAMVESWSSTKQSRWKTPANSALALLARRDRGWPWTDATAAPTDADVSTTAWALHALLLASQAELFRSTATVREAIEFLERAADSAMPAPRPESSASQPSTSRLRPASAHCASAAAFLGRNHYIYPNLKADGPRNERALARVLARPRAWSANPEDLDPQELYFASLVAYTDDAAWPQWSADLRAIVKARQSQAGCSCNSFAPESPSTRSLGRVGANALMTLAVIRSYKNIVWFR